MSIIFIYALAGQPFYHELQKKMSEQRRRQRKVFKEISRVFIFT